MEKIMDTLAQMVDGIGLGGRMYALTAYKPAETKETPKNDK